MILIGMILCITSLIYSLIALILIIFLGSLPDIFIYMFNAIITLLLIYGILISFNILDLIRVNT
jgi:hypothetical protein